jgi:hypothetical protein
MSDSNVGITDGGIYEIRRKNVGRESQGGCRQDELIDRKPPVIK